MRAYWDDDPQPPTLVGWGSFRTRRYTAHKANQVRTIRRTGAEGGWSTLRTLGEPPPGEPTCAKGYLTRRKDEERKWFTYCTEVKGCEDWSTAAQKGDKWHLGVEKGADERSSAARECRFDSIYGIRLEKSQLFSLIQGLYRSWLVLALGSVRPTKIRSNNFTKLFWDLRRAVSVEPNWNGPVHVRSINSFRETFCRWENGEFYSKKTFCARRCSIELAKTVGSFLLYLAGAGESALPQLLRAVLIVRK